MPLFHVLKRNVMLSEIRFHNVDKMFYRRISISVDDSHMIDWFSSPSWAGCRTIKSYSSGHAGFKALIGQRGRTAGHKCKELKRWICLR